MNRKKNLLLYTALAVLLIVLDVIFVFFFNIGANQNRLVGIIGLLIVFIWGCGSVFLFIVKGKQHKIISRLLMIGNAMALCVILAFSIIYVLAVNYTFSGGFSLSTTLFDNKNVMIIVPHQDDDINLVGGMIEQYTQHGSDVTVVFSTAGDSYIEADVRADEVVSVLTPLGVTKENIYYLGFGDQWEAQTFGDINIPHIYNSPDPDFVWTSACGKTSTYGTQAIPCYLELPYTRNNFVQSLESIILEIMPDTIFAVDFDAHIDHRATDLLFEEALCNVLKGCPNYHPMVYKGFCYGTAWYAVPDFYGSLNLLATVKPDDSTWSQTAFGYSWENRVRFPVSSTNLNLVLFNNSVYQSFDRYASQRAYIHTEAVLNGDKVFWERRTDSLLYQAEITVNGTETSLLNDFKLKDFSDISATQPVSSGVVSLHGCSVDVNTGDDTTANCIYLYDNPSNTDNILEGYIAFEDESIVTFGALNKDGSATVIPFPEKQIRQFEIIPTKTEGDYAGLSEIELYHDTHDLHEKDTYLMAVDQYKNFVYDYIIEEENSATFELYRFPYAEQLNKEDVVLRFETDDKNNSYEWNNDLLTVNCAKGSNCSITFSDGNTSTTFSVSNPSDLTCAYLRALHNMGKTAIDIKHFFYCLHCLLAEF